MRYLRGLREAREKALLTQAELATKSGVTVSTISRIENGLQAARISTIRKLAEAVGADADGLIDWERPGPVMGGKGKAAPVAA
jgi:transcriptional regulator with XRE-family HTH domain